MRQLPRVALAIALGTACNETPTTPAAPNPTGAGVLPEAARAGGEPHKDPHDVVTPALLREHTKALADDAMQGRRPGSSGGRRAVEYIVTAMTDLGLEPAGTRGFTQRVPMRAVRTVTDATALTLQSKGKSRPLALGVDLVGGTFRAAGKHPLDAPLAFVGYGVTAPEYEWDDYGDLDVAGKVVVAFVGDPPLPGDAFAGDAMTYYGRWSYKFERALQAGAAGCLVVHEDEPASYGWNVVQSSWAGERFHVLGADAKLPPALELQGWISAAMADELARREGTSLDGWHERALHPRFKARELSSRVVGDVVVEERGLADANVVAKIPGTDRADEFVVITAHWDHLGVDEAAPAGADAIYNGAIDNASGIAVMLAVAAGIRARAQAGRSPRRTIVFIATTAEEQGLLGSRFFAEHPTVPLDHVVAAINLDSMNVGGRTRTVEVVGAGQSSLEETLATVLAAQGRRVVPDSRPGSGGYYRSDHFAFAKKGIPALYFHAGTDMADGGEQRGARLARERAGLYHTVRDEFDEAWTFAGTEQDAEAVLDVVLNVADADARPAWNPGSEFAAARPPG